MNTIFVIGVFLAASTFVFLGSKSSNDVSDYILDDTLAITTDNSDAVTDTFDDSATDLPAYTYKVYPSYVVNAAGKKVYSGTAIACIQWANDRTPAGGTVALASGTFYLTGKIWINKNLVGAGSTTKLVAAKNLATDTMVQIANRGFSSLSKITVSNFEIDGKGASYTKGVYGGVELVKASYCTLSNLYIHHFPKSHGIMFQASSYNTVTNCKISNIGYGGQYASGIVAGTQVSGVTSAYNKVNGCTITACSMAGINWEPGNNNVVSNTVIKSLTSWSGRTVGISIWTKSGYPASNNNQFVNVQVDCRDTNLITQRTSGTVITNCKFTGATSSAVYMSDCSTVTVSGTIVKTNGGHGIYTWNCNKVKVASCDVQDGSGAKKGRGIYITTDSSHTSSGNTITQNKVYNCAYGIIFGSKTIKSTVSYNTVWNCYSEYRIPSSSNSVYSNS